MDIFWAAFGGGLAGSVGALVGVFVSELVRWKLSQPKLVLEVSLGVIEAGLIRHLLGEEPRQLIFSISNTRDRPLTLNQIGFVLKKNEGRTIIFPDPPIVLPYEITAGKSFTAWIELTSYMHNENGGPPSPKNIKFAYARTSDGREFRFRLPKSMVEGLSAARGKYRTANANGNQSA